MTNVLEGKKVLVGLTGSIACYKVAELVSKLIENGAKVRVMMSQSATRFIGENRFEKLTRHEVYTRLFSKDEEKAEEEAMAHIELARWPDAVLIAPATANIIAKLANGIADDLISATCLATKCPAAVAPAMNTQMWLKPSTQRNIQTLKNDGIDIWGPASGVLACKEEGEGRLLEPDQLLSCLLQLFKKKQSNNGLTWLITAGPTREPIDPVRYITNRSSGKMGYALAEAAANAGGRVYLVSGPTDLPCPEGVIRYSVETAGQMHQQVMRLVKETDLFIGCAAVSDYTPSQTYDQKLKKSEAQLNINLSRTEDIVAAVAMLDYRPFTVGFSAETENLLEYARQKMENKRLDAIVANQVGDGLGFNTDTNSVYFLTSSKTLFMEEQPKRQLAEHLIQQIASEYEAKNSG